MLVTKLNFDYLKQKKKWPPKYTILEGGNAPLYLSMCYTLISIIPIINACLWGPLNTPIPLLSNYSVWWRHKERWWRHKPRPFIVYEGVYENYWNICQYGYQMKAGRTWSSNIALIQFKYCNRTIYNTNTIMKLHLTTNTLLLYAQKPFLEHPSDICYQYIHTVSNQKYLFEISGKHNIQHLYVSMMFWIYYYIHICFTKIVFPYKLKCRKSKQSKWRHLNICVNMHIIHVHYWCYPWHCSTMCVMMLRLLEHKWSAGLIVNIVLEVTSHFQIFTK
jgi:hypothetical protein